jgi:uncharacterized membrane protein
MNTRPFFDLKPLTRILLLALAVRLLAVVFSQGFIHSDDHFETVSVAWNWLHGGLWGDDGNLHWSHKPAETIGRFPLYTLFLLGQMKICRWVGITSLSAMMYFIRLIHALISLLPVWAAFRIVKQATRSDRWAAVAGLAIAFQFASPFLGVRNLIEIVGGSLWIVAVGFLYRYQGDKKSGWLYLAGLMTGLAWMIRFQIALAVIPVPFLLWWETRHVTPAVKYSLSVAVMLLVSAFVDWCLLGRFAGSTITYLTMNLDLPALYRTIPLLYVVLLVVLLVPPLSLVSLYLMLKPGFFRQHKVLFWTSISFLALHSLHANQQERFIFPILPAFIVLGVLSFWHFKEERPVGSEWSTWFKWTAGISGVLNVALLVFFTFAYGHKGMIEPLKWFEKYDPAARVLFFQPEVKRWPPVEYAGDKIACTFVRNWAALANLPARQEGHTAFDYVVVYPKTDSSLQPYLDSLTARLGLLEPVFDVNPSYYDQTLHLLNSRHNDNYAAYGYRIVALTVKPGPTAPE